MHSILLHTANDRNAQVPCCRRLEKPVGHPSFLCRKGVSDSAGFQWILRSMRNPRDHGIVRIVSFGERPLGKHLETKRIACPPYRKQSGVCWLEHCPELGVWLVIGSIPICICCFHGSVTQSTRWQPGTVTGRCMYCVGSIELSSLLGAVHRSRNVGASVKERTMLLAALCPGNTLDVLSSR